MKNSRPEIDHFWTRQFTSGWRLVVAGGWGGNEETTDYPQTFHQKHSPENIFKNIIHSFHPCYITFAALHTLQRTLHGQLRIKPVEYGNPVDIYISRCAPACAM